MKLKRKILILVAMTLITWICVSSCTSFSSSTTIVVDSADVKGLRFDKSQGMEIKEFGK